MTKSFKKSFLLLTILSISSISIHCDKSKKTSPKTIISKEVTIENFDQFYDKFHNDSIFQMSRIKFPLEGHQLSSDGEINWSKANWTTLKTKIHDIDTTEYKIDYKKTDKSFYQKFWVENSGFWSEYKFKVINKKWYLVYAVEQNL